MAELGNKVLIFYFPGMVAEAMCWVGCGGFVVGGWGKSKIKLHSRQIPEVWLRLAKRNQTFW